MIKFCANPECQKEFSTHIFKPSQKYCSEGCARKIINTHWRRANPDKVAITSHNWYVSNAERHHKVAHDWNEANPEKRKNILNRRRARKLGAIGDHYTQKQFKDLCNQSGNICLCCKQIKKLEPDHVVPLSKGGSDAIENIQPLCGSCNDRKGSKTIDFR